MPFWIGQFQLRIMTALHWNSLVKNAWTKWYYQTIVHRSFQHLFCLKAGGYQLRTRCKGVTTLITYLVYLHKECLGWSAATTLTITSIISMVMDIEIYLFTSRCFLCCLTKSQTRQFVLRPMFCTLFNPDNHLPLTNLTLITYAANYSITCPLSWPYSLYQIYMECIQNYDAGPIQNGRKLLSLQLCLFL